MSTRKISPFIALASKRFALFLFGNFISQIGTQMQTVAIAWHIYELTHSAASLGVIGLVQFAPTLFFSLLGGLTADKADRKLLIIGSQTILAVVGFILAFFTWNGNVTPFMIYSVLFATSLMNSFSQPARQSVIPHLVPREHFMNAISLNVLQRQIATVSGPAIGGLIIAGYGVQGVYFFNALSFLVFVICVLPIKVPAHRKDNKVTFSLKSVFEGVRFVKGSSILSSTMFLDFIASFFGTATVLMPIFAKDVLKVGAQGLGLLYAAPAIGAIVAGLGMSVLGHIKNQGRVILIAVTVYGLATIGFGFSTNMILSLILLGLAGAGDMISTVLRNTIRQMITPDELRGRMVSVNMVFVQGGPALGEVEAGFLAALTGAPMSVVLGGVGTLIVTAAMAKFVPKLRHYNSSNQVAI